MKSSFHFTLQAIPNKSWGRCVVHYDIRHDLPDEISGLVDQARGTVHRKLVRIRP